VSIWHRISHWLGLHSRCLCTYENHGELWSYIRCNECGLKYSYERFGLPSTLKDNTSESNYPYRSSPLP
jgi:hypothetical protein